jgi:hypothetical protein
VSCPLRLRRPRGFTAGLRLMAVDLRPAGHGQPGCLTHLRLLTLWGFQDWIAVHQRRVRHGRGEEPTAGLSSEPFWDEQDRSRAPNRHIRARLHRHVYVSGGARPSSDTCSAFVRSISVATPTSMMRRLEGCGAQLPAGLGDDSGWILAFSRPRWFVAVETFFAGDVRILLACGDDQVSTKRLTALLYPRCTAICCRVVAALPMPRS